MYRFRPDYKIFARTINDFPYISIQAAAIMVMLSNNLDDAVAQHPHELITYAANIRAGLEYRIGPFSLRGGYAMYPSPYNPAAVE